MFFIKYSRTTGIGALTSQWNCLLDHLTVSRYPLNYYGVTGVSVVSVEGEEDLDELQLYLANTQMPTSTFDPLKGMISMCGINGRTNGYEYDGLGRLQDIKDQDGNIIKTIDYHYKGQQ